MYAIYDNNVGVFLSDMCESKEDCIEEILSDCNNEIDKLDEYYIYELGDEHQVSVGYSFI